MRVDRRAALGFETVVWVSLDTATITFDGGDHAFPMYEQPKKAEELLVFDTRDDSDYPVEVLRSDGEVNEVRVDLVDDLDDCSGAWTLAAPISVGPSGLAIGDRYHRDPLRIQAPAGGWSVEVFESLSEQLGVRLRPEPATGR